VFNKKYQYSKNEFGKRYQYSKIEFGKKYQCSTNEFGDKYKYNKKRGTLPAEILEASASVRTLDGCPLHSSHGKRKKGKTG
jgi:hypothetical protein